MKVDQIYQKLKNDMITGVLPAGTKLPVEEKLAVEFGCARKTLRAALSKLEKEGRLERLRAHGTFVRPPQLSGEQKVLSILIPYPDFITKNIFSGSAMNYFFRIWGGAALAAMQKGWRLQTIPFSKTNDPSDIDYDSLECLQEDSRLIISSAWYQNAFPLFAQRKVRVGFIFEKVAPYNPLAKYLDQWVHAYTDLGAMKRNVIRYLYETYRDEVFISIMNQYTPFGDLENFPELKRSLTEEEYEEVVNYAIELGVENGFIQEGETSSESFIPEFK